MRRLGVVEFLTLDGVIASCKAWVDPTRIARADSTGVPGAREVRAIIHPTNANNLQRFGTPLSS